ncbi:MAG TPA: hypothetical protein VFI65_22695 [Streptosporangiaceae bacterium]|nr:hypothetical protein [Streptosporangiaceae bacterium]
MNAEAIASLTTAVGTLVLAVATYGATKSANRASRIAERSLLAALRPVLMNAQLGDPRQKVGFSDQHWTHFEGPGAVFEQGDEAIYLAFGLRNFGSGIGILQAWHPIPERLMAGVPHGPLEHFRPQSRSLYIPSGGLGFWQGALRDPSEPIYEKFAEAIKNRTAVTIELLYSDMNGGQLTVTRLAVLPGQQDYWLATVAQHWPVDDHFAASNSRLRPRQRHTTPPAAPGQHNHDATDPGATLDLSADDNITA